MSPLGLLITDVRVSCRNSFLDRPSESRSSDVRGVFPQRERASRIRRLRGGPRERERASGGTRSLSSDVRERRRVRLSRRRFVVSRATRARAGEPEIAGDVSPHGRASVDGGPRPRPRRRDSARALRSRSDRVGVPTGTRPEPLALGRVVSRGPKHSRGPEPPARRGA